MIKIKKLKSISETEKRTDIIIDDPKFKNWFKGSKVVDKQCKPLVCFHGTKVTFNSFRPLSHFGTIKASNYFVDNKPTNIEREVKISDNITPVYLSIKNPLEIKDEDNYSPDLGFDMYYQGFITYDELLDVYDNMRYGKNLNDQLQGIVTDYNIDISNKRLNFPLFLQHAGYKLNTKKFISIFENKGYDGMVYKNTSEDHGSISWIIFYSNQVWPIFKNSEDEQLNEIELFHDENNETEREKLYYAKKALNKNLPEKEFKGYTFKIWEDSDTIDYLMTIDGKLVGMFAFEIVNGFNAITYRWIDSNYRGKGLYSIFLQFLKSIGISKIVSDQLMTQAAINSTLKLKNKVQFINIDTKEILTVNKESIEKYITNDYDEETFPWRFLITI